MDGRFDQDAIARLVPAVCPRSRTRTMVAFLAFIGILAAPFVLIIALDALCTGLLHQAIAVVAGLAIGRWAYVTARKARQRLGDARVRSRAGWVKMGEPAAWKRLPQAPGNRDR